MSDLYDASVSRHYAAYRPPLHQLILEKALGQTNYEMGLDVGCGTGQSTIPLTAFCDAVVGVDPSEDMLQQATAHPQVRYAQGTGEALPVGDASVDLVAFAGSLFYTKSDALVEEILRLAKAPCTIVVYDFELLIYKLLTELGFEFLEDNAYYNHSVNFGDVPAFEELIRKKERTSFAVSPEELAHVMLSERDRYVGLQGRLQVEDPFEALTNQLRMHTEDPRLEADMYYATYRLHS